MNGVAIGVNRCAIRGQVAEQLLDINYKHTVFKRKFRADLLVEAKVLIENKAIATLAAGDEAQLFNYLKTTGLRVGLLFNFWSSKLQKVRRIV